MRQRLSYTEEKSKAFYYVIGMIDNMDYMPMTKGEREEYRRQIDRLSKRYGFRKQLREMGYDLPRPHSGRFDRKKFLQARRLPADTQTGSDRRNANS